MDQISFNNMHTQKEKEKSHYKAKAAKFKTYFASVSFSPQSKDPGGSVIHQEATYQASHNQYVNIMNLIIINWEHVGKLM